MHCISHPPGNDVVIRLLNNNNSISISSSSNSSDSGHNNTTNPTDTIDETETNDFRDFLFVVLAFLSVTGCFIYLLCKCSNSCYSVNHLDMHDDNFDGIETDNSMMMIEMGDFDRMNLHDVASVDLTLDQELSEDERSLNNNHQSQGSR